ncbi:thiol-disulfide oxidoreductase DCC family protein [Marinicellulosiphila megalodicopiae]|uniref:thiol-disulfide oxidoreductase DCC family protein n=1 Tax=Marinicellulosiphila megalodicopiae TaxID=2724896 RepID=UPI003BB20EE6
MQVPKNLQNNDRVLLFDGVCRLCNFWSKFIIKFDKNQQVKLCSVQSKAGQEILKYYGFSSDVFETMIYVEYGQCYQKSDAFFRVASVLKLPWSLLVVFKIIPKILRNWVYDRIALNRYKIFGRYEVCVLPKNKDKHRFLNEN